MKTIEISIQEKDFEFISAKASIEKKPIQKLLADIFQDWLRKERRRNEARKLIYKIGEGFGEGPDDLHRLHKLSGNVIAGYHRGFHERPSF
ncbi:MAG: hypothetical protein ACE5PV_27220 [Candidatus Poribacteria bacterium]